ncbi:hypothetical protein TNCV_2994791 [Trichonephila clavipes]|nr:hypothetical protein TNCV_2994791 [Trichonephila clavipes]
MRWKMGMYLNVPRHSGRKWLIKIPVSNFVLNQLFSHDEQRERKREESDTLFLLKGGDFQAQLVDSRSN